MDIESQSSNQKYTLWLRLFLDTINKHGIEDHVDHHEGYKFKSVNTFQSFFDIEATDLVGNLDKAIEPNNLVVGAMYFPKKMLLIYALNYPNETRDILRNLFDVNKEIAERINQTKASFEALERRRAEIEGNKPYNTYIGLRFMDLEVRPVTELEYVNYKYVVLVLDYAVKEYYKDRCTGVVGSQGPSSNRDLEVRPLTECEYMNY